MKRTVKPPGRQWNPQRANINDIRQKYSKKRLN